MLDEPVAGTSASKRRKTGAERRLSETHRAASSNLAISEERAGQHDAKAFGATPASAEAFLVSLVTFPHLRDVLSLHSLIGSKRTF
jgi:hypothetical protein